MAEEKRKPTNSEERTKTARMHGPPFATSVCEIFFSVSRFSLTKTTNSNHRQLASILLYLAGDSDACVEKDIAHL